MVDQLDNLLYKFWGCSGLSIPYENGLDMCVCHDITSDLLTFFARKQNVVDKTTYAVQFEFPYLCEIGPISKRKTNKPDFKKLRGYCRTGIVYFKIQI